MDFIDVLRTEGANNMAGNEQYMYFAKRADIDTMPALDEADPTGTGNIAELAKVSEDIVMDNGKDFVQVYGTLETISVKDELQGERDGKSYKTTLEFFFSDITPESLGFLALAKNTRLVAIVKDLNGRQRLLGHHVALQIDNIEVNTGSAVPDRRGAKISAYCFGNTPAPIFEGRVKLTGSTSGAGDDSYQEIIFVD